MCFDEVWVAIQSGATLHRQESEDVKFLQLGHSVWHQAEGDLCVPLAVQSHHRAGHSKEVSSHVRLALDLPVYLK